MTLTPAQHMEVVEASPALVGSHDKAGWLALFAADAVVEDPVGTRPQRRGARPRGPDGEDELGRFYEVFIAPNQVRFEVELDILAPPFVARAVQIHTRLPNGYQVSVPAHIVYEVCEEEGVPKLRHLAAYWELRRMPRLALAGGLQGLAAVNRQTFRMLRVQRLGGMTGYLRGFGTAGKRGRRLLDRLVDALDGGDAPGLPSLFVADASVMLPVPEPVAVSDLADRWAGVADGDRLSVTNARVAGWSVSFGFTLGAGDDTRRGIGVLDLQRRPLGIASAKIFLAE